ncbi:RNA polymerase I-specific transcription initiation factor RRN3 [Mytilinidion resinicola]|uniref:RNA polymerase I-specific transcription initiation factor RRN3 n=1 Tax=Mytilinidion resinicola TaxID=574789 RepID=A0A6A6YCZ4_9PEZI|nr:RNA polymerase I-specific transcription initiation factor RRN3 [Mytilinidion resinicola]KAF2806692.1 RNA polymerase I-specific transcription initiation factor RRN3 [Mytilinidion resinicola]
MVSLAASDRATTLIIAPSIGGSLKRKHEDSPSDHENIPSSPTKRLKVAFNPDVNVQILSEWQEKDTELIREEVRRALEKNGDGDSSGVNQLNHLISIRPTDDDAPSTPLLQKYILVLTEQVGLLDRDSSGLVHAILDCRWLSRSEQFVSTYIRFLGCLVSAKAGYTSSVLQKLVDYFIKLPSPAIRHQDDPRVPRRRIHARVHQCLKYLLRLFPAASRELSDVLGSNFPFSTDTTKVHVDYIKNLLKLATYAPELKGEILALVTERLVKIDVQIQVDMEDFEDDIEESLIKDVKKKQNAEDSDEEDDGSDSEDSDSSEESSTPEERRTKEIRESIGKMDAILDILFEYYHPIFAKGDFFDINDTFESLLSQFANIILPTYRSRHTQFLLFHFSQSSPELTGRFAGACSHLAFDKNRPQILRLAAAAYLASFISRGAHVSKQLVRDVVDLLGSHLNNLRESHERQAHQYSAIGPNLRRYGTYYGIAQALLYIFCFRWRDLIEEDDDLDEDVSDGREHVWHTGIKETFSRNIYCKLNPLKICSPVIVGQFARVAHHLRFLYVFPLLETNKRVRLSRAMVGGGAYGGYAERETALSAKKGEDGLQLDAYFPFDPYLLPKSRKWLIGDYIEWKDIDAFNGMNDDDEDDEDEEDGEDSGSDSDSNLGDHEDGDVAEAYEETATEAST